LQLAVQVYTQKNVLPDIFPLYADTGFSANREDDTKEKAPEAK
jgi:hypothetical protein